MKRTSVTIKFPSQFSKYIDNVSKIEFEGEKFSDFVNHLETQYGNVKERLLEEDNSVRPYINFFVDKKNILSLKGLDTVIPDGASISLLLSRAGG